jgi:hypothetical protein
MGNFDCSGSTDIQITFSTTVTSAAVYPSSLGVTPTISGNTLTFTISGPQKFYVDINGDHYNNCIHVSADSLEVNPPQPGDANVVYVSSGTDTGAVTLSSGQTLYIQGGGAVAAVYANGVSDVNILGHGFVYRASYNAIEVKNSSNVVIDGVKDLNHGWGGGGGCGINCAQSSNVSISNTMCFSHGVWGDGYDIFCSNGVAVNSVFIRTNDDAITFYGGGKSGYTGDCENITVTNSTLLPDLAHSFNVGVYGDTAGVGKQIRDITVSNIDICNQSRSTSSGCMNFMVGDKVRAANIKFQGIRVQDFIGGDLITMNIIYNSTYDYNPGRAIDSIYFMNITYTGSSTPVSAINGYDSTRMITNVFFNNLVLNGTTVTGPSAGNVSIGTYTGNIVFSSLATGGTYVMTAKNSGMCAGVNGGSTSAGAQVVQNTYSGATAQQWVLEDAGSGYYKIRNVNSGLYMDITDGSTAEGADLEQWSSNTGYNQQFQLAPVGSGRFAVFARNSGLCLNVNGSSTSGGAAIIQWPYQESTNELWLLQPMLDTGTYVVTSKHSNLVAAVSGASTTGGADVVQNAYGDSAYEQWVLVNAGNGYYKFKNANSGLYMDVSGGSTANGTNLIQWTSDTGYNQQFYLYAQGSGYYNVLARHSDKCVDVNGASTSAGATLIQWPATGSDNQSWLIQLASAVGGSSIYTVARAMVTNIRENTGTTTLKVFPNPVTDVLYIQLPGSGGGSVEIYDLHGGLITGGKIRGGTSTIGMAGLSPGTYIVRIHNGQQQISKKVIKM